MKTTIMNGWKDAPHCWKRYLLKPIRWERTPVWLMVEVFGIAIFFTRDER